MMDKAYIISEIKRTASDNGGVALGFRKFCKITGIKDYTWKGYWRSWGEALRESGYSKNIFNVAYDKNFLIACLAKVTQSIGRFPTEADLRLAKGNDDTLPSLKAFRSLGMKSAKLASVRKFAIEHVEYADIIDLLPQSENEAEIPNANEISANTKTKEGFVYLGMLKIDTKKRYKIGKTNLVERRNAELSLQLPEKLELVHYIRTDDMSGIEAYWHKRFADKNTNGEWFDLSNEDVRAFKNRKIM